MITLQHNGLDEIVQIADPDAGVDLQQYLADQGYADWTVLPHPPIAVQRDALKTQVEAIRTAKETSTASTPVGTVTIDEPSKAKILGALSMCRLAEEAGQPFALNFTLADGSRVALTSTTVRQLASAVGQYVAALYDHAHSLLDALDAATTDTDLNAIDLEAGWP